MRKAVGVHLKKAGFWIFSQHRVMLGSRWYVKIRRRTFAYIRSEKSAAVLILQEPGRALWAVGGDFYWDSDCHSADEIELLVWDRARRKDARVERLRKIKARPIDAAKRRRERIPDDSRAFVWSRDGGTCARCGSDEDLQFDHIVPFAKGGGDQHR